MQEGLSCLLEHMFEISHSDFFKSTMNNLKHMFYALLVAKPFTHKLHAHRKCFFPSFKMVKLRLKEVVQGGLRVDPGSSNSRAPRSAWGRGRQRQGWGDQVGQSCLFPRLAWRQPSLCLCVTGVAETPAGPRES